MSLRALIARARYLIRAAAPEVTGSVEPAAKARVGAGASQPVPPPPVCDVDMEPFYAAVEVMPGAHLVPAPTRAFGPTAAVLNRAARRN